VAFVQKMGSQHWGGEGRERNEKQRRVASAGAVITVKNGGQRHHEGGEKTILGQGNFKEMGASLPDSRRGHFKRGSA